MYGTIVTSARAAAPFVGSALVSGSKALAALAVATKASRYAQREVNDFVDELSLAREAAQPETEDEAPDNVVPAQEYKIS